MTSFVLTGNVVRESIDGEIYYSVFCHVKGEVTFSKIGKNKALHCNASTEHLLEQVSNTRNDQIRVRSSPIVAAVLASNLICIRFKEGERYTRKAVLAIHNLIYNYCLTEEWLTDTQALETYPSLINQIRTLILTLRTRKGDTEEEDKKLLYLITSIRYGSLNVFGDRVPSSPFGLDRKVVLKWLKSIRKRLRRARSV